MCKHVCLLVHTKLRACVLHSFSIGLTSMHVIGHSDAPWMLDLFVTIVNPEAVLW